MAQWFALKAEHPDALLFLRMGDFYELFFADAEAAAGALDIALTARGEQAGAPIPMCGVPVHAAEAYLARLIRRGFRVAVAEQMEDPKTRTGKAPIRRAVVRLVTPGTLTEDSLLEAARPNLLLAVAAERAELGAAWLDISTGLFETAALPAAELPGLLARLDPAEILAPQALPLGEWEPRRGPETLPPPPAAARRRLAEAFGAANLDAFGSFADAEACAAAAALDYVRTTAAGALPHLSRPAPRGAEGVLALDPATRTSLELLRARDGGTPHSLFAAIDRTLTAPGARRLGAWIAAPLTAPAAISARQDMWSWMGANPDATARLRAALRAVPDMARALGRLSMQRGGPRDLAALRAGLAAAREAAAALTPPLPALLEEAHAALATNPALEDALAAALAEPAPLRLDDGPAIRAGFDAELDAERALRDDSRRVLAGMQLDYAQRFGVASLKIRHHAQLGYVIEVPAAVAERLRADPALTLRQSMANGARFATAELAALDRRIAEAAERAATRERAGVRPSGAPGAERGAGDRGRGGGAGAAGCGAIGGETRRGRAPGAVRCSRARPTSWHRGRPPSGGRGGAGRSAAAFVPNDCDLSPDRRVLLLTGPNMAGKSTFLRQNALLVRARPGRAAGAGRGRPPRHGRPAVLPRRRRRRPRARPLHLHGGNDRDRRHPAPGRPALPGCGRRDRPRHRHAGRAGDRLGGAGGAAQGDPLPRYFCHTFPRTCGAGRALAAAEAAYDAGQGMEAYGRVPARSGGRRRRAFLGRACRGAGRRAGPGGAPGGDFADGAGGRGQPARRPAPPSAHCRCSPPPLRRSLPRPYVPRP